MFDSPHGYISPSWYSSPTTNVPTWNYTTILIEGSVELIDSTKWLLNSVIELSDAYETSSKWKDTVDKNYLNSLLAGIIGLRIKVEAINSKFKLSQNKSETELSNLTKNMENEPLSRLMKKKAATS